MHVDRFDIHASQVVFAAICVWLASRKRRSVVGWGIAGFVFAPLALLFLLCCEPLEDPAEAEAEALRRQNRILKTQAAVATAAAENAVAAAAVGFGAAHWHVGVDDSPHGPVGFEDLRKLWQGNAIGRRSLVWTAGMKRWQPIERVAGLPEALSAA